MSLLGVVQEISQQNTAAGHPTDYETGTVTSADPLEITINTAMAPLKAPVLILTESVVEKKIPVLEHAHNTSGFAHTHQVSSLNHSHSYDAGTTGSALAGTYPTEESLSQDTYTSDERLLEGQMICYEHGKPLPVEDGYIILNRALEAGDQVLMLRVAHGQRYIILSRVFEVT